MIDNTVGPASVPQGHGPKNNVTDVGAHPVCPQARSPPMYTDAGHSTYYLAGNRAQERPGSNAW